MHNLLKKFSGAVMSEQKNAGKEKECGDCYYHPSRRWSDELNVLIEITNLGPEPTLSQRLSDAHYIAARNIVDVGIATKKRLMWPKKQFTNNDVVNFSAWLLANVQVALLQALPPHVIDSLLIDLNERLSFVCDTEQQDDNLHDQDK